MNRPRAQRQLDLIADVLSAARASGVPLWLRGGWAMDFFLGEVTREHDDIDWFAWAKDAEQLAGTLIRLGHTPVPGPPAGLQLDFLKDGLESSFTLVDRDGAGRVTVAGGPWAGTPWPDGLLGAEPGRIGALEAPIVDPRVQIEIKRMMPVWDPARPRRAKDAEDIARLEAALRRRAGG
ncbi:aminoglycoside adenylyltransferase [Streptomyces sp. PBH53]|uniref:nucleotidyltransferase domain-containing protein n=1 Tax=Streptomyces sp. PBH53 TaxID=1577075 RepID=UPI0006566096|nr:aminoglycoside adenylyltransferase [Streptomyces sp. PBH53]AKN70183.1 aminoglycoside adenylyltransferase [Streptomyces sp. PBH53]